MKRCRAGAEKLRWMEEIELFYGRSRGAELELESTPGSRPWSRLQPPGSKAVGASLWPLGTGKGVAAAGWLLFPECGPCCDGRWP